MHSSMTTEKVHRRLNLLTGEYILVSPHRNSRPWSGLEEKPDMTIPPGYDPDCYLCPGNIRAKGERNPQYRSTFVFTNDFSALLPEEPSEIHPQDDELLIAEPESGLCRVICYSPRHDLTLSRMKTTNVLQIVKTWHNEYLKLGSHSAINHVQIFENRGLIMGCSNPHPHGQIWATQTLPTIPALENDRQKNFSARKGECLLCSYLKRELEEEKRIILQNRSFVALVPYWAVWPFEVMLIPRVHASSIDELSDAQQTDFASIMIQLGVRYDNLFQVSFPYSMGIHQQPTDGKSHDFWHWHVHYLPPLMRSQSIKKHMVGFELTAMPQRDLSAETAAMRLRCVPDTHYLETDSC